MNATTWARRQFVAHNLLNREFYPLHTPFDGLDMMILLSWLLRKLSDSDNQPFVLHYYDLRPPNIILDKDGNFLA
jgi:hypothetical protein